MGQSFTVGFQWQNLQDQAMPESMGLGNQKEKFKSQRSQLIAAARDKTNCGSTAAREGSVKVIIPHFLELEWNIT